MFAHDSSVRNGLFFAIITPCNGPFIPDNVSTLFSLQKNPRVQYSALRVSLFAASIPLHSAMLRSAFSTFVVRSSSKAVRSHYPKVATAALTTAGITLGTAIYLRKESKHLIENLDDDGLPRTYIPEKMERYWDEQTAVIPLGRIIEIISIMFPFVFAVYHLLV